MEKTNVTRWVMKTHMGIDDCSVQRVCESPLNPLSILTTDKFFTWLVLDSHQSNAEMMTKLTHTKKLISSKSVEVFILEEVLQNSVQINQMTRRLVENMNGNLEDQGHVPPGTLLDVKQGSNLQGPPITIFELTDVDKSKFVAFMLSRMMKEGMQAGDLHILSMYSFDKFIPELGETIRLRCPEFLSQLGINDETEVDCSGF